jgi:hypothetical protein
MGGGPLSGIKSAVNNIVVLCMALTIGVAGLAVIRWTPILILARNVVLSALGEESPGLVIEGDMAPPDLDCDYNTGKCQVRP